MRSLVILFQIFFLFFYTATAQDSAIANASDRYTTSWELRKIFMGKNYRRVWATPVKMPVFDINKEKGGLKITRLGGGAQTKSLRLTDSSNTEWVLRTIDKDIRKVMPTRLQKTPLRNIIQDMISTAYPYAPLVVGELAMALSLSAPDPILFFVPEDTAFGPYQQTFTNTVCMLEKVSPTKHGEYAISTDSMLQNLYDKKPYRIDDTTFLKARLLDMLIVDWDRHKNQYKWGVEEKNGEQYYYPVVRDRDQAFFYSDGLVLLQVRWFTLKFMTNFTKSTKKLRNLNNRSWLLDKVLLANLDENAWRTIIQNFQQTLTDSIIEAAVKKLPSEIYHYDGNKISAILKARRDGLPRDALKYYEFLSTDKKLNKTGSQEKIERILEEHPGTRTKKSHRH